MKTTACSLRRRTTAASAALLLGLALAACGGSDDTDSAGDATETPSARVSETATTPASEPTSEVTEETTDAAPAEVPTEEELAAALLTSADVPAGFTEVPSTDDDEEGGFQGTCLEEIGKFSDALGSEPDSKAEAEFTVESQTSQSSVTSQIEAYADPAVVAPAFAEFTDSLTQCTTIETTDDQGVTYSLQIAYDDAVDLPGADDQLSFDLTGTVSAGAQSFDVGYRFVVALTGPFISIVGTYALGDDSTGVVGTTDDLAALQAERVAALG